MDRFHQLQVYVAVAEEEGFAAAARRLQLSPPAVTRAVASLEDTLGVKLLDRTTRYVRATEAGRRYLEDARQILAGLEAADETAAGINAEPRGHLAVTAPVMFGRLFVMPGIVDYLERYPAMEVEAVFLDRSVNLLEEGLDVGVRIGELPDSSMRALRVGSVRHCAGGGARLPGTARTTPGATGFAPAHPDRFHRWRVRQQLALCRCCGRAPVENRRKINRGIKRRRHQCRAGRLRYRPAAVLPGGGGD